MSRLPQVAGLGLLVLAAFVLRKESAQLSLGDMARSLQGLSWKSIVLAGLFTAISYALLSCYDVLVFRAGGRAVPAGLAARTGFIASALSQTLGFGLATGGGVRMRLYRNQGLSAGDVLRVTLLSGLAFWLGLGALTGTVLVTEPQALTVLTGIPDMLARIFGAGLLSVLALCVGWRRLLPEGLRIGRLHIVLPGGRLSLLQMVMGTADITATAAALWVLFPAQGAEQTNFLGFAGPYAILTLVGFVSHVPGGLGILEAGLLLAFPSTPAEGLLASALAFRLIYYVFPFLVAGLLFAASELKLNAPRLHRGLRLLRPVMIAVLPGVVAAAVFLGGFLLLLSGATPALAWRMEMLRDVVPLPFIEVSHLINSLAGYFLLILSVGLYRRLDAAWALTVVILGCGIAVSLMKGLDWEEATVLGIVLSLTVLGRKAFYRRSSLLNEEPSPAALLAILLACAASTAVGFLAYRSVDYSSEMWWQVAYSGDAPRFLRASLLTVLAAGGTGVYLMLRPSRSAGPDSYRIPPQVRSIANRADCTDALLALTGDKRFLLAKEGDAFLMYDVQGTSWVTMGDPVGNPARFQGLLWAFRELVDRNAGRPVFYQVRAEYLPRYLDLGLSLLKLGEEAIIDLSQFSLDGGARANLRQSARKAEKQGLVFEMVPAADSTAIMPELAVVSADWLAAKRSEEKGFSVGHFDPAYLSQFDHAVLRREGRIVAVANIWPSAARREASVDLMRHCHDAPRGHMDFLFVQLLLWAKAEGYERFNLGMAPLSGLEDHPLASAWHKAGNLIFEHGGQIYGFEGLRAFKEKFRPDWQPRYLACPGGIGLPLALLDVMLLVSRQRRDRARRAVSLVSAFRRKDALA